MSTTILRDCSKNIPHLVADSAETTGLKWAAPSATPTIFGCSLDTTTDQTLSNATSTYLNFGAENFDSGGYHDNSTNNSRITIPSGKGGYYLIFWSVWWDNGTVGERRITVEKNRTTGLDYIYNSFGDSGAQSQNNAFVANLTAGDYIEINARQTSGGNLNVKSDGASTQFGAVLLGV